MHPANVLVTPQRTGNPVISEEDFLRFPFIFGKQVLQIVWRLMQVEDEGMVNVGHDWLR